MKRFLPLLLLNFLGLNAPLHAQNLEQPKQLASPTLDSVIVSYFDDIAAAYKKLNGLRVNANIQVQAKSTSTQAETTQWKRPFFVNSRQKAGNYNRVIVADGQEIYMSFGGKKERAKLPGTAALVLAGSNPFYGDLLEGKNPMHASQKHRWFRGEFLGTSFQGGALCDGVKLWGRAVNDGKLLFTQEVEVWFDADSRVMRAFRESIQLPNSKRPVVRHWKAWKIELNPEFAPETFTLPAAPPPSEEAEEEIYWNPALKVGAAPFPLSGKDLNGQSQSLKKYRGKVLLLDFWATWCGPCVEELPEVKRVYTKYKSQGFEVLGVSLDSNRNQLAAFVNAEKLNWPQLFDGKAFEGTHVKKYGVQGIPFVLLLGKDGKIAAINPRGEALEPAVRKALAK